MRIIKDEAEAAKAAQIFMQHLKKGCSPRTVRLSWGGPAQDTELFVNARYGFWSAARQTGSGWWVKFGIELPSEGADARCVCDMRLPSSGFDPDQEGFFLTFGGNVLAAHNGRVAGAQPQALASFFSMHDYGPTIHTLAGPSGGNLDAFIVASALSPELAFDVSRFVSAVNDFSLWSVHGLMADSGGKSGCPSLPEGGEGAELTRPAATLKEHVQAGVRDKLLKYVEAKGLDYAIAPTASGGFCLCTRDGMVAASFQVKTDLSPESLYEGIGQLLMSRGGVRAAKFLILPGQLGPYFTQALFRHDIQAATYKLTREMGVVLDTDAIFPAIHAI